MAELIPPAPPVINARRPPSENMFAPDPARSATRACTSSSVDPAETRD
jgi:hypothetical protein